MDKSQPKHETPAPLDQGTSDEPLRSARIFTIPNVLSLFRWIGSPALLIFAALGEGRGFVIWYLVLSISDWIDGKIAVGWNQRSILGARLDTFADATLYGSLILGGIWLWRDRMLQEWPWLTTMMVAYAIATLAGLVKFGRWPSYHTRTAKLSWGFAIAGVAGIAWDLSPWPLRIATLVVTLGNLESLYITYRSRRWLNDVIGFWAIPQDALEK